MSGSIGHAVADARARSAFRLHTRAALGARLPMVIGAAVVALACAAVLSAGLAGHGPSSATRALATPRFAKTGVQVLPSAAARTSSRAPAADPGAYRIAPSAGGFSASNPAQVLQASFTSAGVEIRSPGARIGLRLQSVGYGAVLARVGAPRVSAHGDTVALRRAGLEEWYANGAQGIEQGFTIPRPLARSGRGPLTLSLRASGSARPALSRRGASVLFGSGRGAIRYGRLVARDARGATLPSRLEVRDEEVLLRVDTRDAAYPVRIDPFVEQVNFISASKGVEEGFSVALSADGNTALVGEPGFSTSHGAARVLVRTASGWQGQAGLITGAGRAGDSVALSADGNTALVGVPTNNSNIGAVDVYTRSGSSWTQQTTLTGPGETGAGLFGFSVALSADGNTALVGGLQDNSVVGAVWVFTRSGSTWSQQGSKLTASGEIGKAEFGNSVSLSADGNTALIGGVLDNGSHGAAWVFTRSGETWTQQGSKLTGGGESGNGEFGFSTAISEDGNTALISGAADNGNAGAAWVFTRSGETWAQQGEKLTAGGESGAGEFGFSVALSGSGNEALLGAPADNAHKGAAWVFTRSGETWTQLESKLTNGLSPTYLGWSAALSSDGNTAAVGDPGVFEGEGGLTVFVNHWPTIESVSPIGGALSGGTSVTITGQEFSEATEVHFGSKPATSFTVNSNTSITAVSPAGAKGTVEVSVTNSGRTSIQEFPGPQNKFTYGPVVTLVSPHEGPTTGGQTVTITGADFTGATAVKFSSAPAASFIVNSDTSITAVTPVAPSGGVEQAVNVTVTTPDGSSPEGFGVGEQYVFRKPPAVKSILPKSGGVEGGNEVVITGTNFATVSEVKFGSTPATILSHDATHVHVTAPAGVAGTVDVRVTTGGGPSPVVASDHYKYTPTVTGLTPKAGPVAGGTSVTMTGTGFALGKTATAVKFGTTKAKSVNCVSSTECLLVSPGEPAGTVEVKVTVNKSAAPKTAAADYTYS